jgi:ankyrin repeat protein
MPTTVEKLLQAAGRGDLERLRAALDEGIGVNDTNDIGYTALMSAARSYRVEIVSLLIELGADVNAITSDGQSVLHAAVGETPSQPEQQAACVKMLLDAGAKGDVVTPSGHTPLMQAAWFGCIDAAMVFLNANVRQDLRDTQCRTAKDIAIHRGHESIALQLV